MNAIQTQVQSILVENGLDFEIQKVPLFAFGGNFQTIETNYFGLLNTKTGEVINSVKQGYTISQNAEVVEMVLRGIEPFSDKLNVTFGGSLNGGRKVYLQLKVEGKAKVGNDTLTQYVTIIDSNDGSTSLSIGIGDLCMRCQNQFFKFYKAGNAKFRHTATIEQRIKEIPMLIEIALNESLMSGGGYKLNQKALEFVTELVGAN